MKNNIEYYNKIVKEIHQYFLKNVGKKFTDLTFANFIYRIVSISVPEEHYSQLSHSDKEDIFSNIICELIEHLAAFVTGLSVILLNNPYIDAVIVSNLIRHIYQKYGCLRHSDLLLDMENTQNIVIKKLSCYIIFLF
jgi:hypothetical protein